MNDRQLPDLADVKVILNKFANGRIGSSPEKLELEFGDLLLYLLRLADKAGIDLIESGIKEIVRRQNVRPRVVGS